jgi:hypothetical protein
MSLETKKKRCGAALAVKSHPKLMAPAPQPIVEPKHEEDSTLKSRQALRGWIVLWVSTPQISALSHTRTQEIDIKSPTT